MTDTTVIKKSNNLKAPKLFPDELIDQLLAQVQNKDAESILGESGLAGQLKKSLAERMLAAELTHHLETEGGQGKSGNHRNGTSSKTVITPNGELHLDIARDRQATFEPQLIGKYQRRLPGFDDHVISMYARGMSVREIQGHLLELYGLQVSPDLISTVTDEVLAEVEQWQQRPLEAMYPIVYFDALRLKIRDEGTVRNKAVYLARNRTRHYAMRGPRMRANSTDCWLPAPNTNPPCRRKLPRLPPGANVSFAPEWFSYRRSHRSLSRRGAQL
ncbi:Transposase, Mutator family [Paraburkholderia tuberum]|uniref:Mutator family transposase n=1 Tax=Paraburkholderia tuberum TaxID=157910 RepID=A0A1H1KIC6_9BURK|nr:Transposase, Mutator family [Paraburkholderia tuberum]